MEGANIFTHEGYMARFRELVGENQEHRRCCEVAWTRTESELRQYGLKRYSSYSSFKVCRSQKVQGSKLVPLADWDPIVLP